MLWFNLLPACVLFICICSQLFLVSIKLNCETLLVGNLVVSSGRAKSQQYYYNITFYYYFHLLQR